jgi:caffeoyl-CoA O-methyltransferase
MNFIDKRLEDYCIAKSTTPSELADSLENYTKENVHGAHMLIGKMEASFFGFLISSTKTKRILELGTFTGYSALIMAELLPKEGELITIDINKETVALAQSFWDKSPHGYKIKSVIGEALNMITSLEGEFDFIFIDADKRNYTEYLKLALSKLSSNGIIVLDNVLWSGRVLEEGESDHRGTKYIKEVNDYIKNSPSLYGTLLPIRDGIFLVRKLA